MNIQLNSVDILQCTLKLSFLYPYKSCWLLIKLGIKGSTAHNCFHREEISMSANPLQCHYFH